MIYRAIAKEIVEDVSILRLNDDDRLNAISPQMVDELLDALSAASRSQRAIVLTGTGRMFSSGANLASLSYEFDESYDAGVLLESHFNPLMETIRDLPIPFVTAVNGPAVGVGSTVALAGDFIVVSDQAYFFQAFRRVGVAPDAGTAYLLTRAVGRVRALEMMLLGERLPAQKAVEWGLANRTVPPDQVATAALTVANELAKGPTKALGAIRRGCWHALDATFAEQLVKDRIVQRDLGKAADHKEAILAFFAKRPPVFTGH
ncbi:Enoyl-CoA hydratase [Rhizobiales bacterium GAS191]|nr:Enoyl-CoA hydratase [Rhizobiales bacterium GAS191]